jgi:hypothetical protein
LRVNDAAQFGRFCVRRLLAQESAPIRNHFSEEPIPNGLCRIHEELITHLRPGVPVDRRPLRRSKIKCVRVALGLESRNDNARTFVRGVNLHLTAGTFRRRATVPLHRRELERSTGSRKCVEPV